MKSKVSLNCFLSLIIILLWVNSVMADKQFILNKAAEYARQYGIDPRIFVSQIFKESTFNPKE